MMLSRIEFGLHRFLPRTYAPSSLSFSGAGAGVGVGVGTGTGWRLACERFKLGFLPMNTGGRSSVSGRREAWLKSVSRGKVVAHISRKGSTT